MRRRPAYTVEVPLVPGTQPPTLGPYGTLQKARTVAASYEHRCDLRRQDVAIRRDDAFVEYCGPSR